jgi:hypothetical protein
MDPMNRSLDDVAPLFEAVLEEAHEVAVAARHRYERLMHEFPADLAPELDNAKVGKFERPRPDHRRRTGKRRA